MMIRKIIPILMLFFISLSCKKDTENDGTGLPAGATPYSSSELTFVPYNSTGRLFKKAPSFSEELVLNFKERLSSKTFYAWDQTFFTFGSDAGLELELRLRYTKTGASTQKSLAVYMPYRDPVGELQQSLFELPISPADINSGFFGNLVLFHDTLVLFDTEWFDVFEVNPLSETIGAEEGTGLFSKIYYNAVYGLIELDQKNGSKWLLHP